jgi:hypothetical protein
MPVIEGLTESMKNIGETSKGRRFKLYFEWRQINAELIFLVLKCHIRISMMSTVDFRYFINMVKISLNKIKIKTNLRQRKRNTNKYYRRK